MHDEDYEKAMRNFSISSMSNAKWVRLFSAIVRSGILVERAEWKYVGYPRPQPNRLPLEKGILPNRFADEDELEIRFDMGETLRVVRPVGWLVTEKAFRIDSAAPLRWEWNA